MGTLELLRSAERSAVHLESRDLYMPDDPDWLAWHAGERFDPAQRWAEWFELVKATTGRGVVVRRARIVSEPVSDYIQFEYDVTKAHNVAAGEDVRWLPRNLAAGLAVPPADFWLIDGETVVWNHFAGDSSWIGEEVSIDPLHAQVCGDAFEAVWRRAIPHDQYTPRRTG